MSEDGITAFAEHVVRTNYQSLPPGAVKAAKTFILDGFGVGVAGSAGPWLEGLIASRPASRERARTRAPGSSATACRPRPPP